MNQDFLDLLRALCAADARFLVVGAYAVSYHSEPRTTGALDIWVEPTPENAGRVYQALAAFGAPLDELAVADLATPNIVFQMGVAPRRIDILTSSRGFCSTRPGRSMPSPRTVTSLSRCCAVKRSSRTSAPPGAPRISSTSIPSSATRVGDDRRRRPGGARLRAGREDAHGLTQSRMW
ncbi:MAG TPA: hypothetical protein VH877_18150 [Polyangia bacterium]|nr:hypothetical protein [Polyangia bacterium]